MTNDQVTALSAEVSTDINDNIVLREDSPVEEEFIHPMASARINQCNHAAVAIAHVASQLFNFFWLEAGLRGGHDYE